MTAVWMVTIVEGKEDLHEVVPDGIFWNESIVPLRLLDHGGEVATAAKFHEDVENTRIAVNVSVMIAYNVFVMEVLQDVAGVRRSDRHRWSGLKTTRDSHFCNYLLAVALRHTLEVKLLACKYLKVPPCQNQSQ